VEDRSILDRPGPEPTGDLFVPPPGVPRLGRLALIHGGFWRPSFNRRHLRPMAAALGELGWEVVSLEYRRVPGDPDVTVGDVRAALSALAPDVIAGHSAGGHLALWAAAALRLKAVALAPVADLELGERLGLDGDAVRAFLGGPAAGRPDLDPIKLPSPRATLIHGSLDSIVPIGLSTAYVKAHPDSRLVELADTAHFELIDPLSDAWPIVIQELQRLLA
jgi:acetyl esterase/lipase